MTTLVYSLGGTNGVAALLHDSGEIQRLPLLNATPNETSMKCIVPRLERLGTEAPEQIAFQLKRVLGRRFDDPLLEQWGIDTLRAAPNGGAWIQMQDQEMPPEAILGAVLGWIRDTAEVVAERRVKHLVLLHPPLISSRHRQAYLDAGTIAGFDSCHLFADSFGTLIHAAEETPKSGKICVIDIGTTQISASIIDRQDDYLALKGASTIWCSPESELENTPSQDEQTARAESLFRDCLHQALARTGIVLSDLTAVLVTGGHGAHPAFKQVIESTPGAALHDYTPEDAVLGAARYAKTFHGDSEFLCVNVLSSGISLSIDGGDSHRVMHPGTWTPTKEERILRPQRSRQFEVLIDVVETIGTKDHYLAKYSAAGIPGAMNGKWALLLELRVDSNGIFHLGATELLSGKAADLRRIASAGLPRKAVMALRKRYE